MWLGQTWKDIKKNMGELQSTNMVGQANGTSNLSAFLQTIRGVKAEVAALPRDQVDNFFNTFIVKTKEGAQAQANFIDGLRQNHSSVADYLSSIGNAEPTFQGYTAYCQQATQANKKFTLSTTALNAGLKVLQSIGIGVLVTLASVVATKIVEIVDEAIVTYDELNEKIEENRENYEKLTSELDNINSELKTTQARIEELNRLDKLSVVEQNELKELKEYNAELERNNILIAENRKRELNDEVKNIHNKYSKSWYTNDNFTSLQKLEETNKKINSSVLEMRNLLDIAGYNNTVDFDTLDELLAFTSNPDIKLSSVANDRLKALKKTLEERESLLNSDVSEEINQIDAEMKTLKLSGLDDKQNKKDYEYLRDKRNEYLKLFYGDVYEDIQIDFAFNYDKSLSNLKNNLLNYFADGGTFEGLEDKFGVEILNKLKKACDEYDINYQTLLDYIYGDATNNYADVNRITDSAWSKLYNIQDKKYQYGDLYVEEQKKELAKEIENMDASTIKSFLAFVDENGANYDTLNELLEAFEKTLEPIEAEVKFSLSEDDITKTSDFKSNMEKLATAREEYTKTGATSEMDLLLEYGQKYASVFEEFGVNGRQGMGDVLGLIDALSKKLYKETIEDVPQLKAAFSEMYTEIFNNQKQLDKQVDDLDYLEGVQTRIASGEVLELDEITGLINQYEDLADSVLVVGDAYSIDQKALLDLVNSSKTSVNELISLQYKYTKASLDGAIARRDAMKSEVEALYGVTSAQLEAYYEIYDTSSMNGEMFHLDENYFIDELGWDTSRAKGFMNYLSEYNQNNVESLESKLDELEERYKQYLSDIETAENESGANEVNFIDRIVSNSERNLGKLQTSFEDATTFDSKNSALSNLITGTESYAGMLDDVYTKYSEKAQEIFSKIPEEYQDAAQYGSVAIEDIADEGTRNLIQKYWEYIDQYQKYYDEFLETEKDIIAHKKERFDLIKEEYDSIISLTEAQQDYKQSILDYKEIIGSLEESDYYSLISSELAVKAERQKQLNDLQVELANLEKQGLDKSSSEWREKQIELINLQSEIYGCDKAVEEFKDSILELRWDNFNKGIEQISNLESEIDDLITLMGDASNFKDGVITETGIAKLGLYAQQYVNAKKKVAEYSNGIEKLEVMYRNGSYNIEQYNEKLAELNASQREAAIAMNEAKQSFISFREEALNAEIDKMRELADEIKLALDAEKERQDYLKSISDQQDYLSSLEKRIAILSLSDDRKDIAQRLQLEQELAEKKEALEEEQRQHSIDEQKEALDKEIEAKEEARDAELEELRNNLDAQDALMQEYLGQIQGNYTTVYDNIQKISDEFGVEFTDSLTSPWESATGAAQLYAKTVGEILPQLNIDTSAISVGNSVASGSKSNGWIQNGSKWQYKNSNGNYVKNDWVNDLGDRWYSFDDEGFMRENEWIKGKDGAEYYVGSNGAMCTGWNEIDGKHYYFDTNGKLMRDGYTPDGYVVDDDGIWDGTPQMPIEELEKQKVKIAHYAKGTLSVPGSGYAIVDEYNKKELKLHADKNGKFEYFEYGSSILPADISSKLLDIAKNYDPRVNMPFLNKDFSALSSIGNTYQPITLNITSPLIHVEGGLDSSIMGRVENMVNGIPNMIKNNLKTLGLK